MQSSCARLLDPLTTSLGRFENVALIAAAAALGILVPGGRVLAPLVTPLVVVLVAGSFRDLRPAELDRSDGSFLLLAFAIGHLALPVVAAALGSAVLTGGPLVGLLVVAAAPTTAGSAIVWSRLGGGDVGLATVGSLSSLLLAPAVLPGTLALISGRDVGLAPELVVRKLLVVVVGGLVLAALVRNRDLGERTLDRISRVAIALLVYVSVASSDFTGTTGTVIVAVAGAALAVTGAGLALSLGAGRVLGLGRPRTRSLFFVTCLKNLGISLVVAASLGAPGGAVVAVTVYYVAQQAASALLAETI